MYCGVCEEMFLDKLLETLCVLIVPRYYQYQIFSYMMI